MIQDIFLPKKIGNYYLFSQKIVGIDITKTHIYATVLIIKGSKVYIEKQIIEPINGDTQNHDERVIATLPAVMQTVGKVNHIRTAITSTQVIFKELRMPFTSREKISLVVRFEVEPLLPFSIHDAVVDFIITDINKETQTAQILVAAVQKQYIAQHLALFEQAGINPTAITVDAFALYALYTQIPAYTSLTDIVILLDLDMHITRIIAIDAQQLRIIRTLPYGLVSIAKEAGNSAQMKATEVLDQLVRFGPTGDTKSNNHALNISLGGYFNKIQFALTSTIGTLRSKNITKILLSGPGAEIKDIASFAQNNLQFPCEIFDGQLLAQNANYHINKNITMSPSSLFSVGTALLCPPVEHFNLQKEEFEKPQTWLLLKQAIVAGVLIIILFGSLITHGIMQSRRLTKEIKISRNEAVEELKNRFPEIPEEEDDLEEVLKTAKEELAKEERLWLSFSSQARASFLEYLLELSTRINKQQLGLIPEQLTIVDGVAREITLKAKVRDFEALTQLEKALQQSKLFSYVESPRLPEFTMKINVARTT